jgi:NADH-quinone oxidoreductase subunit F
LSTVPRSPHGSRVPGWYEPAELWKPEATVPTPDQVEVPPQLRAEIEAYVSRYPDRRSAILPALKAAQRLHGWCSPLALEQVACVLGVTPAELHAVATFYDMLETEPKPKQRHDLYVCTNISCSLRGADRLYEALLAAAQGKEELNVRSFECLGACELAPMVSVDGNYLGPLSPEQAPELVDQLLAGQEPFPDLALKRRPCADPAAKEPPKAGSKPPKLLLAGIDEPNLATLAGYRARGGYEALAKARQMAPEEVLSELEASGLRGRGGAGFQMARKIAFLPKGDVEKFLVCNADESEPGTFKDRELIQKNPHMLIEGIAIACHAAGIEQAFIYIRGEYELQAEILERALGEAQEAGLIGGPGSTQRPSVVLHRGAGAYICGEETGLLDSLEGKRGNPRLKPPFPAVKGLYQGPTLINNVETLATVPAIIKLGGKGYASLGTETSTGTKIVSVSGHVQRPGNYEIELGIPAREIVYGLAGGPPEGRRVKCWFPGGSSAPVLTEEELDLPYDFDTLAKAGSMLGSGAIIVVDDSTPIIDVALKVAKFYAHESCGKCTPCREGTRWTVQMLERIKRGEATPLDIEVMASVQENIIGHCLCVLGDAMAMPIGSIIRRFREELEEQINAAQLAPLEVAA